ncbi:RNA-dependent RNA polymerase, partial [Drosophila tristis sigmavirus]
NEFDNIWSKTLNDANLTKIVPDTFFDYLLDRTPVSHQVTKHPQIIKYREDCGRIFWELHQITLLLNITTVEGLTSIHTRMPLEILKQRTPKFGIKTTLKNLGTVLIFDGFIYFLNDQLLFDRNMLLMAKDTIGARFQTLLSIEVRYDDHYTDQSGINLCAVYHVLDRILMSDKEKAYDVVKMVEPICNLKLSEMARKMRPNIPEFPKFKLHVQKSIDELSTKIPRAAALYQLIMGMTHVEDVLTIFGSFRHWGHPFIDYRTGLNKLYEQVTVQKDIDTEYAGVLASEFAKKILITKYKETKSWSLNIDDLDPDHPLTPAFVSMRLPDPEEVISAGHTWHLLPLKPCYEIPDMIDPSNIYSDKSHSYTRKELKAHLQSNSGSRVPSHKVLKTFISRKATCWPEFLQRVNDHGLDLDSLIIGLKAKEREIKKFGRFFALMSWELREYFVVTEYLIKLFFLPLFKGLTMADDLTMLIRKMMDSTHGQGLKDEEYITIANHLDFEKWNNHQRAEATDPVFKVMGQFVGYPNLFVRTHEFFQKSWIYYADRGDQLQVIGDQIKSKGQERFCWNGQPGGLEGLRQKGWSIISLLIILIEGDISNTGIKCLAQGDNQVICTQYKPNPTLNAEHKEAHILNIIHNNNQILERIEAGTKKLGLIINRDETMQSADYMTYGKLPVYRGNFRCLEGKRWSRVLCVTNDQLPTFGSIMSTISSNALTVSHFSESPINPIYHYNLLGNFGRIMNEYFNPATQSILSSQLKRPALIKTKEFKIATLYLDPSFGGIGGISLTRFLIRTFPDPITESLSFFKIIASHTSDRDISQLFINFGHPPLAEPSLTNFCKLMEDPLSLNIFRGISSKTVLRNEIKDQLIDHIGSISNEVVKLSVLYIKQSEPILNNFLYNISPLFPRFISQFKSSSFFGIADSVLGLFQNSKTIRNYYSRALGKKIDMTILKGELVSVANLIKHCGKKNLGNTLWKCSSTQADHLRRQSWGRPVLGATIPHPAEMIGKVCRLQPGCKDCSDQKKTQMYITAMLPKGLWNYWDYKGPLPAYLGSSTSESTSILRPWEKETDIPLVKRASDLRKAIGWFVEDGTPLADAILDNLKSLTGEDWDSSGPGFFRTGSALHRFSCSRQPSGGYSAQCPVKSTWMSITTNTLVDLGEKNHDFMFQALILYVQALVGELHDNNPSQGWYHGHISCLDCLREILEPHLQSAYRYSPPDLSRVLEKWKPASSSWSRTIPRYQLLPKNWGFLSGKDKSYHIGRAEGFLYAEKVLHRQQHIQSNSLFPLTLQRRIDPESYMEGLVDGIMRDVSLSIIFRDRIKTRSGYLPGFIGKCLHLIYKISEDDCLVSLWRAEKFEKLFSSIPRKIPPSYPTSNADLGALGRNFLRYKFHSFTLSSRQDKISELVGKDVWIFADINHSLVIGLMALSQKILPYIYRNELSARDKEYIRSTKKVIQELRGVRTDIDLILPLIKDSSTNIYGTDSEVRHAAKSIVPDEPLITSIESQPKLWGAEYVCPVDLVTVYPTIHKARSSCQLSVPRIQDPLISGLRLFQAATGAHYKVRSILAALQVHPRGAICGGDGSGGISSMILRTYPACRVIFNSLLDLTVSALRGSEPSPPAAIGCIPNLKLNCVNYNDAWQHPNDLSEAQTWRYFTDIRRQRKMKIDLIILDMEVSEEKIHMAIMERVSEFCHLLLESGGTLIFKTYLKLILNTEQSILHKLINRYRSCQLAFTSLTSSHSSEVYCIFHGPKLSKTPDPCYPDILAMVGLLSTSPSQCTREME